MAASQLAADIGGEHLLFRICGHKRAILLESPGRDGKTFS
jgi:hypothetical protein